MPPRQQVTRRPWYLRPLPILSAVAVLVFSGWFVFGHGGAWDSYKLRCKRSAQAEQIRDLELKKQRLVAYLADLRAGEEMALERAARERDLIAPQETIYDIKVAQPRK